MRNMDQDQGGNNCSDVLSQDDNKPVIKEESMESRQLPLINKKKLKPFNSIPRARFQKRLPNISSAGKRTLPSVVDATSNQCEENQLKDKNEGQKLPPTENVPEILESKQNDVAQKNDEKQLFGSDAGNSLNELNITRPAVRKNTAAKIIHRIPFIKKPQPNIRNVDKNSTAPHNEKLDVPVKVENSPSKNVGQKLPSTENVLDRLESKQSDVVQKTDEEQLVRANTEKSLNELNITRPAVRKNAAAKIIHRTPFFKKPQPNVRNVNKNSTTPQKEKMDISAIENSQSATNENQNKDNLEPITIEDSEKLSVIENIKPSQENNQRKLLEESDVNEQTFPHNIENSANELNNSTSAVRKNASSTIIRRTPFVKKPFPNVRNVVKTSSNSSQEETLKTAPAEKSRRLSDSQDEEPSTPSTPVPNSIKFPHITSILTSKKRNLKEKELPNKRRKYGKGDNPPERNKMTIMDLIYYNPTENPMQVKKKSVHSEIFTPKPCEEISVENSATEVSDDSFRPVPKLVVNENGDINIDESSLIVQRNVPDPSLVETVTDETTYSSFRKKPAKQWGKNETAKFYRALSLVGTDFGLMEKLMPGRTRRELKLKFKREERHNLDYINRAMYDSQTFDISILLEENLEDIENSEQNDEKKTNGKRGRKKKKIGSSDSKIITLSDDSMDSSSQNSYELTIETQPENTLHDRLGSSPQQARPTAKGRKKDTDRKMEVTNSHEDNEIVEIEFAYSRRNRKPKLLAEGFIDSNDLEIDEKDDLYDCDLGSEMECNSFAEAELEPEENEILELQREVERNGNVNIDSTEQSDLIITDIGLSDTEIVSNVIADEVVSSKRTYTKKSQKPNVNLTRKVFQNNTVPRPSFTKYTPAEEYPSYKESRLEFAPDRNLKTYTRSQELDVPKCRNFLLSSVQSPSAKKCNSVKETTTLTTSLNGSSNQSIVIPMTPEANARDTSCNSLMIFAKAPDQENILHLFMYNNSDAELNTVNCKVETS